MSTNQSSKVFKALADDVRVTIVRCLASSDIPVKSCDVVKSCASISSLSQPAMSHHFKKLTDAGIVSVDKQGTENVYQLNKENLAAVGLDVNRV